jgi:hypothetical protein
LFSFFIFSSQIHHCAPMTSTAAATSGDAGDGEAPASVGGAGEWAVSAAMGGVGDGAADLGRCRGWGVPTYAGGAGDRAAPAAAGMITPLAYNSVRRMCKSTTCGIQKNYTPPLKPGVPEAYRLCTPPLRHCIKKNWSSGHCVDRKSKSQFINANLNKHPNLLVS